MNASAIIVAAGHSKRFGGDRPKQFELLAGRPMLAWTIQQFQIAQSIDQIVLVVPHEWLAFVGESIVAPFGLHKVRAIISGGETRRESVRAGLESLNRTSHTVAIHDGARPLVRPTDIDAVVEIAVRSGAAMLATPVADTIKRVESGFVRSTVDRSGLFAAQTPQVFSYELILEAHRSTLGSDDPPDDACLIEQSYPVQVVIPAGPNPKVTTTADFALMERYLAAHAHE